MNNLFDPVSFGLKVKVKMKLDKVTYRELERICDVDKSSLHRVVLGRTPSVENYLRIERWLDTRIKGKECN